MASWGCCGLCSRHQSASTMDVILCVFWKFIWIISILFQFTAHFSRFFMIYFYFGLNMTRILLHFFVTIFGLLYVMYSHVIKAQDFFCLLSAFSGPFAERMSEKHLWGCVSWIFVSSPSISKHSKIKTKCNKYEHCKK